MRTLGQRGAACAALPGGRVTAGASTSSASLSCTLRIVASHDCCVTAARWTRCALSRVRLAITVEFRRAPSARCARMVGHSRLVGVHDLTPRPATAHAVVPAAIQVLSKSAASLAASCAGTQPLIQRLSQQLRKPHRLPHQQGRAVPRSTGGTKPLSSLPAAAPFACRTLTARGRFAAAHNRQPRPCRRTLRVTAALARHRSRSAR